jgi:dTDP-4-amino-4,6-dideoxygalactose transaminase
VYALSIRAQERLVETVGAVARLTVLRLADLVDLGHDGPVATLGRRAVAGLPIHIDAGAKCCLLAVGRVADVIDAVVDRRVGSPIINVSTPATPLRDIAARVIADCGSSSILTEDAVAQLDEVGLVDTSRLTAADLEWDPESIATDALLASLSDERAVLFAPALPAVIPPRPAYPELIAERQHAALCSGELKHGNRWTQELHGTLDKELDLRPEMSVVATTSGTAALRLAVIGSVGHARPGDIAVLPSFTFPATAEVLLQLGFGLRYADVDEATWTLDPIRLSTILDRERVRLVVAVDTFGNPCDYDVLRQLCDDAGVCLVADSAAALGSLYRGRAVAGLAAAHSYSMSFAKVLSAGGAGGALALQTERLEALMVDPAGWTRSELLDELHAIVAMDQLSAFDDLIRARQRIADVYESALPTLPGVRHQVTRPGDRHSHVHWVMRLDDRDLIQESMLRLGVGSKPYFLALHLTSHPPRDREPHDLPVTADLHEHALALPMSSEMTTSDAERVVLALQRSRRLVGSDLAI